MPNVDLDAMFVRNATSNGKTKETYYDNSITGFTLECRQTGSITYAFRLSAAWEKSGLLWISCGSIAGKCFCLCLMRLLQA
jgi:hypothetical protein